MAGIGAASLRIGAVLLAAALGGCGATSGDARDLESDAESPEESPPLPEKLDSPFDASEDDPAGTLGEVIAALEASDADAAEFATALASGDPWAPLEALPQTLQSQLLQVHDLLPEPSDAKEDAPGGGQPAHGLAAVVFIANDDPKIWKRNVIEWTALAHFGQQMGWAYARKYVCLGDEGTVECLRAGLLAAQADPEIAAVDLIAQGHGSYRNISDNAGGRINPEQLLEGIDSKLRYGMFGSCHSASGKGFTQAFIAHGGEAAYGSLGISQPFSDLAFQSLFGNPLISFELAVDLSEINLVDAWDYLWHDHDDQMFTHKTVYGPDPSRTITWRPGD